MNELTFNELPKAVSQLFDKLNSIGKILLTQGNNIQPETNQLLTIKQAGKLLSLSAPTIYCRVANKTGNKSIVTGSPKRIDWFKLITQVVVLLKLILEIIHHG